MVPLASLWLPILLAAALVWVASSIMWMVMPHHRSDFKALPDEEAARQALRPAAPGQYVVPHMATRDAMKDPAYVKKLEEGPRGIVTIAPPGPHNMGKSLGLYFLYCAVVTVFVAYIATRTLPHGTAYLRVFQVTATAAWMAYAFGSISESIWFSRPWSTTWKNLFDGLVYGLLTGGVMGWRWPGG